jgi:AcrR family transcriptional regulator
MARPRSEDKQIALLEAATEVVAAQGLGAPTSLIAKRAGVAEGTLFRYFATKNELLNALYLYQCRSVSEALQDAWDETLPLKNRMETTWNNWIDWGVAHPEAFSAMAQLEVSDKLAPEACEEAWKICGEDAQQVFDSVKFEGLPGELSGDFLNEVSIAIAQATISFAIKHPQHADACKAAAFNMTWQGLNGA